MKLFLIITILLLTSVMKIQTKSSRPSETPPAESAEDLYSQNGTNWTEPKCVGEVNQSPINIVRSGGGIDNTVVSTSHTSWGYKMPPQANELNRLTYDGNVLYMENIDLGYIEHFNDEAAKELYKVKRIEFHVNPEHQLTIGSQTVDGRIEIQIIHDLESPIAGTPATNNPLITNKKILVKRSIVSIILTTDPDAQPDLFMESLGISGKLI
jgi:hypothetical protein